LFRSGEFVGGDEVAGVGGGGAAGDGRVHVADVVLAELVEAGLGECGAGAGQQAEVLAVEEAVEAAGDLQLEAAQGAFGGEVGEFAAAGVPARAGLLRRVVGGGGTGGGQAVVPDGGERFHTPRGRG